MDFTLPPEVTNFLAAARAGDQPAASNAYAAISRPLEQGPFNPRRDALHAIRQSMLGLRIALEYHALGAAKYATAFRRDIAASLTAGGIYFGGTDPGRGLVAAHVASAGRGNGASQQRTPVLVAAALAAADLLALLHQAGGGDAGLRERRSLVVE